MVRDANCFTDRMITTDEKDPLHSNIFSAKNPDWSRIRKKLSPIFTRLKLNAAFLHIDEISKQLLIHFDKKLQNGHDEFDCKRTAEFYTMDISLSVFFGFNSKSLLENNADELFNSLHSINEITIRRTLEWLACFLIPLLFKILKVNVAGKKFTLFIRNLMQKVLREREKSNLKRNDFLDMLLELKNNKSMTEDEIYSQSAIFLVAGYETLSTTLAYLFYELASNPEIQKKLKNEIKQYFNGQQEISFETVAHPKLMPYLDNVLNETFRKYTTLPFVDRVCTKPDGYSLEPFNNFKIPFGFPILIPIHALSHDERYFEDPWTFNPDRFEKAIPQGSFLPFGWGSRSCIGERFAVIILKTAIVRVLKNFHLKECERTPKNLKPHMRTIINQPEHKIYVKIVRDTDDNI